MRPWQIDDLFRRQLLQEPIMLVPDPIARRVARRHNAAVLFRNVPPKNARVEYSNTGRISAVELMRMLEPQLGEIVKLRFRQSLVVDPNGIEWEAVTASARALPAGSCCTRRSPMTR